MLNLKEIFTESYADNDPLCHCPYGYSKSKINVTSMNMQRKKGKRRSRRLTWRRVLEKEFVTAGMPSRNYKRID